MYLLDTNVFIEAYKRYYSFEICPSFWKWLKNNAKSQNVYSIKMVYNELKAGKDELSNFIESFDKDFFINENTIQTQSFAEVSKDLQDIGYDESAQKNFSSKADFFLIALAYQTQSIIVTHEAKVQQISIKRIKIPNIAEKLKIECIDTFDLLKRLKVKF